MKIFYFALIIVFTLLSCKEKAIETKTIYLKTINDSLQATQIKSQKSKTVAFVLNISDTVSFEIRKPTNWHKRGFKKPKRQHITNSESGVSKVIFFADSLHLYIENTTFTHIPFKFSNDGIIEKRKKSILKSITGDYFGHSKIELEVFQFERNAKLYDKPELSFTSFSDELSIIYDDFASDIYFFTTSYGCCNSKDNFEIFNKNGTLIVSSNDLIQEIIINHKSYFFSINQHEYDDTPILIIKYPDGSEQYIALKGIYLNGGIINISYNVIDKTKNQKFYNINPMNRSPFSSSEMENINNAEIVLPFNQKDTLRIPFENGKPFGKNEKFIELSIKK